MSKISQKILLGIVAAGHRAPSADNTQPWHLSWDGEKLSIHYDQQRVNGATFPAESPSTLLAIGALIENLCVAATVAGLTPEVVLAPSPGQNNHYGHIALQGVPIETPSEPLLPLRHCNRQPYQRRPVPSSTITALTSHREGSARCVVQTDKADTKAIANLARQASWIRFQTREVHQWLGRSLRFSKESVATGDGLDVRTLALPPGGSAFLRLISDWRVMRHLNKIGMYRPISAVDAAPLAHAPAIMAICGGTEPKAVIDSGRLMQRAWTTANDAGLAAHPYYVIADQLARLSQNNISEKHLASATELHHRTQTQLGLQNNETLHMLLRIGYPKKDTIRSARIPLEKILSFT